MIADKRILPSAQRDMMQEYIAMWQPMLDRAIGILSRAADREDKISQAQHRRIRQEIGQLAQDLFALPDQRSYDETGSLALTPFAVLLNRYYARVVSQVVIAHQRYLTRVLADDIYRAFNDLQLPSVTIGEMADPERAFQQNPLAQIDPRRRWVPMHRWTDDNGYQLSDRIWDAATETRKRIEALLAKGLSEGMSAKRLGRALTAYVIPTPAGQRSLNPAGKKFRAGKASYAAIRLARTEISRAHNHASYTAALFNPYVQGYDWRLSARHPKTDICDTLATIGKGGQRLKDPYPIDDARLPPAHPNCICTGTPALITDRREVNARLRDLLKAGNRPNLSPVQGRRFVQMLLGMGMMRFAQAFFEET